MECKYFQAAISELSVEEMLMLKGGNAGPGDDVRDQVKEEEPDITIP